MNIPTRLLVLQRLQALLADITPANGFDYDLTGKVYRGRILFGQEVKTALPAISILESPRADPASDNSGLWKEMRRDEWPLLIQGLAADDAENPSDPAYYLEAAVETQLAKIIATDGKGDPVDPVAFHLGELITDFRIGPPVVRPPEDKVSATAFFFLPVWVGMSQQAGKPYTSA